MKKVTMLDLMNGDVMIKFGENYSHIFYKGDVEDIENCIKDFEDDEDTSSWDNNEIEKWEELYSLPVTYLTSLKAIKDWNKKNLRY
jgi:hypothetical protein